MKKNPAEKKFLEVRSSRKFSSGFEVFLQNPLGKKRLPNRRNTHFQRISISSGFESHEKFPLDLRTRAEQAQCRFPAEREIRWKRAISSAFPANRTGPYF